MKEVIMPGTGPVSRGIAHHPYPIKKLEELPESLMQLAYNHIPLFDQFDFMMVVPNQSFLKGLFGRRLVPQQALLFYPEGVLHLQDTSSADRAGKATWIEARHLTRLTNSLLLLYGKLEIMAERGETHQTIEVEYNTVAYDLIKPFIQRFVQHSWLPGPEAPVDLPCFEPPELAELPYKFQSGLRIYALQAEEELCGFVFQPEISEPRLGFFRRKITPNTLLALTDRQVVLIQEEIASASNYGWVISHFPRQHISKIQSDPYYERQIIHIQAGSSQKGNIKSIILAPETAQDWMHLAESLPVSG
jgi:hypothetical protein